ncbi:MAG TPA: cation:proton antiporter [Terriglobia bacterium]|nr:cation:proton antiporter [Terriglobia bacterium]
MSTTLLFALLGALTALAFGARQLFRRTRVPDVIVLMVTGVVLGPILGLVKGSQFEPITYTLGTLAFILILFEGGLELDLRTVVRHFPGGLLLSFLAYAFSLIAIALVMRWSMHIPTTTALIVGAVLGCTSSSITLPVLQQIETSTPGRVIMTLDASLSDTFAILTLGVLIDLGHSKELIAARFLGQFLYVTSISLVLAILMAVVWSYLLPKVSDRRFRNPLTLAVVLLVYSAAQQIGVSGLITVFFFGIFLANIRRSELDVINDSLGLKFAGEEHHAQVLTFHAELSFLVRTFFFVLLGAVVELKSLIFYMPQVLGVLGAIILARAVAVKASSWSWKGLHAPERELILWIMPRGLITVVLALEVVQVRGATYDFLPALAFATILATNLMVIIGSVRASRIPPNSGPIEPTRVKAEHPPVVAA